MEEIHITFSGAEEDFIMIIIIFLDFVWPKLLHRKKKASHININIGHAYIHISDCN